MKNLTPIFIALVSAFLFSCAEGESPITTESNQSGTYVQVVDFHSTHRCQTCNAIENQTLETINNHFKTQLDAGQLVFSVINVDEEENYPIALEYETSGTALFINVIKDGESIKTDLTEFAFMTVNNEDDSFEIGLVAELQKAFDQI
jgi:hypothetical protein